MTKIELKTEQFKKFVQAITTISNESFINLDETGIWVRVVDSPNYAMATVTIKRDKMEKYVFQKGIKPTKVAVDWSTIRSILKSAEYPSTTKLNFQETELDLIWGDIHAVLPYLESDKIRKEPNAVKVNSTTSFEFHGDKLYQIRGLNSFERFKLIAKQTLVELEWDGEFDSTIVIQLANEHKGQPAKALYATDYLTNFGKVFAGSVVTAHFKTDHPIRLCTNNDDIDIEYLLAPRIESAPEMKEDCN